MFTGTSMINGTQIGAQDHLAQSIADIFTTPQGSRVRRRDYGFDFNLIDQPQNERTILKLYIATAKALMRWEPRVVPLRIQADRSQGRMIIKIYHKTGQLSVPMGAFKSARYWPFTYPRCPRQL